MKNRYKISEDELMYRQMLQDQWKVEPSKKAVLLLQQRIDEVLKTLGVNVMLPPEEIQSQMQERDVFINSLSEGMHPSAAGLYFSAVIAGELRPYAWICTAKVNKAGEVQFPIVYWGKEGGHTDRLDEGGRIKVIK